MSMFDAEEEKKLTELMATITEKCELDVTGDTLRHILAHGLLAAKMTGRLLATDPLRLVTTLEALHQAMETTAILESMKVLREKRGETR